MANDLSDSNSGQWMKNPVAWEESVYFSPKWIEKDSRQLRKAAARKSNSLFMQELQAIFGEKSLDDTGL